MHVSPALPRKFIRTDDMSHERHLLFAIASDVIVRGVAAVSRGFMPFRTAVSGGSAAT